MPKQNLGRNLNALPKPTDREDFTGYVHDEANATKSNRQKKKRKNPNQKRRHHNQHQERRHGPDNEKCSNLRLLEQCNWPQCNRSCPTFTNPITGKKMSDSELLNAFGLELESAAVALGVDIQTLKNMDLIKVLT